MILVRRLARISHGCACACCCRAHGHNNEILRLVHEKLTITMCDLSVKHILRLAEKLRYSRSLTPPSLTLRDAAADLHSGRTARQCDRQGTGAVSPLLAVVRAPAHRALRLFRGQFGPVRYRPP